MVKSRELTTSAATSTQALTSLRMRGFSVGCCLVASTHPDITYWLDFTDPEVTQYFINRANGTAGPTINGYTNHSDFQDLHFDFKQGWIVRKPLQYMQFGNIPFYTDIDMNHAYIFKMKFRKINHWTAGGEDFRVYEFGRAYSAGPPAVAATTVGYANINKWDYGTNVRLYSTFPGQGGSWICTYGITPANELGESVETAFVVHVYRPQWLRNRFEYRYTCSLAQVTSIRTYNVGYGAL